jgi:hypothetical protein
MKRDSVNMLDLLLLALLAGTAWRVGVALWNTSGSSAVLRRTGNKLVAPVAIGDTFASSQVEGQAGPGRVVLVLSEHCHVCRQSVGFYRRLAEAMASESAKGHVLPELVAVTSDPDATMEGWLRANGITVKRVTHVDDLPALGVRGTPTVMLVGRDGRITDLAVGRLTSAEGELIIRRVLGVETSARLDRALVASKIAESEARRMIVDEGALLLDVRERCDFRPRVLPAKNIPLDELRERMFVELDPTKSVIVDCRPLDAASCEMTTLTLLGEKFASVSALVR